MNGEAFQNTLQEKLPKLKRLSTITALDRYTKKVAHAIWKAAEAATSTNNPTAWSKTGWSEKCKQQIAETKKLQKKYRRLKTEEAWEEYQKARNKKSRTIQRSLRQNHREKIEKAAESAETMWRVAKWARNRDTQTPSVTPEL
jgi:hypothetical protein